MILNTQFNTKYWKQLFIEGEMSPITTSLIQNFIWQLITDYIIFLLGICLSDFRSGKKSGKNRERGEFLFLNHA